MPILSPDFWPSFVVNFWKHFRNNWNFSSKFMNNFLVIYRFQTPIKAFACLTTPRWVCYWLHFILYWLPASTFPLSTSSTNLSIFCNFYLLTIAHFFYYSNHHSVILFVRITIIAINNYNCCNKWNIDKRSDPIVGLFSLCSSNVSKWSFMQILQ